MNVQSHIQPQHHKHPPNRIDIVFGHFTPLTMKTYSYKKNQSRKKKVLFKPGHTYLPPRVSASVNNNRASTASGGKEVHQSQWLRPSYGEYWDTVHMSVDDDSLRPTKLRPAKSANFKLEDKISCEENIIVNIQSIGSLLQNSSDHHCENPAMKFSITKRQGLCITGRAECSYCHFKSTEVKLHTTFKKKRGPETGTLNDGLALALTKSKMGVADARLMMSCLNINPPDGRGLQRKLNQTCDRVEAINEESMVENQRCVWRVNMLRGEGDTVDLETDTSYNNRPQAGFEAATQSFSPMVEASTTRKLVVSLQTANKLCCKRKCKNHTNCKKNYNTEDSISSSEAKLLRKNLDFIRNKNILTPCSVTSDASAQVEKTIRDYSEDHNLNIKHYHCFIHKLRTLQKNLRNIRLKTRLAAGQDREAFIQRLATCIRARIRYELVKIRRLCRADAIFLRHAQNAVLSVLPCFSGIHNNCRRSSFTCCAHLPGYSTKFLPYGKHLDLDFADMDAIQSVICKHFRENGLRKVCKLATTNRCENLHQRVFTYAPKNTTWARNFTAMCHSAVHSSSHGTGKSMVILAEKWGLKWKKTKEPFYRNMLLKDQAASYHRKRKQSPTYRTS